MAFAWMPTGHITTIAAIEAGLADLDAGWSHTHTEVLAEMLRLTAALPNGRQLATS